MRWTFFQQLVISTKERLMSMPLASKSPASTSAAGRRSALPLAFTFARHQAPAWTCAAHTDGRFGYFALSCLTVRWIAADAHNAPDRSAINSP